jgi:hypothetical protein
VIIYPVTRRERQSITVARYKLAPASSGRYVMSPAYLVFGVSAVKSLPAGPEPTD